MFQEVLYTQYSRPSIHDITYIQSAKANIWKILNLICLLCDKTNLINQCIVQKKKKDCRNLCLVWILQCFKGKKNHIITSTLIVAKLSIQVICGKALR